MKSGVPEVSWLGAVSIGLVSRSPAPSSFGSSVTSIRSSFALPSAEPLCMTSGVDGDISVPSGPEFIVSFGISFTWLESVIL